MGKLCELGLEDNTLVFCLSDNGGSSPHANNDGLHGSKWFLWEGGIRESWLVQWPGTIPAGKVIDEPVIQLDVFPTTLAAAGVGVKPEWQRRPSTNLIARPPLSVLTFLYEPHFAWLCLFRLSGYQDSFRIGGGLFRRWSHGLGHPGV